MKVDPDIQQLVGHTHRSPFWIPAGHQETTVSFLTPDSIPSMPKAQGRSQTPLTATWASLRLKVRLRTWCYYSLGALG